MNAKQLATIASACAIASTLSGFAVSLVSGGYQAAEIKGEILLLRKDMQLQSQLLNYRVTRLESSKNHAN